MRNSDSRDIGGAVAFIIFNDWIFFCAEVLIERKFTSFIVK